MNRQRDTTHKVRSRTVLRQIVGENTSFLWQTREHDPYNPGMKTVNALSEHCIATYCHQFESLTSHGHLPQQHQLFHQLLVYYFWLAFEYKSLYSGERFMVLNITFNTTLVMIGTDCIGSCKSNYHTITTTMANLYTRPSELQPYNIYEDVIECAGHNAKQLVSQCINGASSNSVEGELVTLYTNYTHPQYSQLKYVFKIKLCTLEVWQNYLLLTSCSIGKWDFANYIQNS